MRSNIEKRIAALESRFHSGEIVLTMPDGKLQTIYLGRGEDVANVFARAMQEPDSPTADAIRRSVSVTEPGGSHMIELCHALLASPVETNVTSLDNAAADSEFRPRVD